MKKFWFYCYDNDSTKNPYIEVLFLVDGNKEFWDEKFKVLKELRESQMNLILKIHKELLEEFRSELRKIGIQFAYYKDWEITPKDEKFIYAKDIPLIIETLTKIGWVKEYIPYGP